MGSGRKGSIYQRHDHPSCPPVGEDKTRPKHRCRGRWVGSFDYKNDQSQKRDRRVVYGKTKGEVDQKLSALIKNAPRKRPAAMPTVGEWMDEWMRDYKPLLRPSTRVSHNQKIGTYIKPLIGNVRLDRLTTLQVERIESYMTMPCPTPNADGKCKHIPHHGLSVSSARQTFVILNDALNDAVKDKRIAENPAATADKPSSKQKQRPHLKTALVDRVLAVAGERRELDRWSLALLQGLRQGEALGLTWGMVDLDNATLTVAQTLEQSGNVGRPKSDASYRTIPLFPETAGSLRARWAHLVAAGESPSPGDRVFGESVDVDRARWRRLLVAAGVPHVALHSARQSTARRLEEEGWSERLAAEFLGHSNVAQTFKYQRGAGVEQMRKAIEG